MTDFRFALRTLRKNPGFTAVTVILLGLGIGASGVIFSAADALLLRRLAVRDPDRLFEVVQTIPQLGKRSDQSWEVYTALRDRTMLVSDVIADCYRDVALTDPGAPEQIRVHFVSENYFTGIGVNAAIGRALVPGDVNAVVISDGFWKRRFAADPAMVGRTVSIRGNRFTIVGVLSKNFTGFSIDTAPDVRLPLAALKLASGEDEKLETSFYDIALRLKSGVSVEQATAETNSIWRANMEHSSEKLPDWRIQKGVELEPLRHGMSRLRERFSGALLFLGVGVALLMLMVCANVAGLLLARSAQRQDEISMRVALGASRWRIMRQMLSETIVLSSMGCAAGIAITYAAAPLLVRALPVVRDFSATSLPVAIDIHPNGRVLACAVLVAFTAAILAGLAPSLRASRIELRSTRVARGWRGRRILVVVQVALCMLLLAGAGLLVRTFDALRSANAGFDRDHVVTFTMNPELNGYTRDQLASFTNTLLARVRDLSGVRSAAISEIGLMRGTGMKMTVARTGEKASAADFMNSSINRVTPDYFETMGMRILNGRVFTIDKIQPARTPVIVNSEFVRRFFPNEDPIGRIFGSSGNVVAKDNFQIVGVSTDAHYRSLREAIPPTVYEPSSAASRFVLHVRTQVRPESIIAPVREVIRALDPQLPIIEIHTLAEEVDATLWSERLVAALGSIFGALAAILAGIGLYGLLAYAVAQRTREIGIRVALGAEPLRVLALVGRQALILAAAGATIGLIASLAALPLARNLLYGVAPSDPLTLTLSIVFVAGIAVAATAIPITRALRVDPAVALRQD
jgi:predicted permease